MPEIITLCHPCHQHNRIPKLIRRHSDRQLHGKCHICRAEGLVVECVLEDESAAAAALAAARP